MCNKGIRSNMSLLRIIYLVVCASLHRSNLSDRGIIHMIYTTAHVILIIIQFAKYYTPHVLYVLIVLYWVPFPRLHGGTRSFFFLLPKWGRRCVRLSLPGITFYWIFDVSDYSDQYYFVIVMAQAKGRTRLLVWRERRLFRWSGIQSALLLDPCLQRGEHADVF